MPTRSSPLNLFRHQRSFTPEPPRPISREFSPERDFQPTQTSAVFSSLIRSSDSPSHNQEIFSPIKSPRSFSPAWAGTSSPQIVHRHRQRLASPTHQQLAPLLLERFISDDIDTKKDHSFGSFSSLAGKESDSSIASARSFSPDDSEQVFLYSHELSPPMPSSLSPTLDAIDQQNPFQPSRFSFRRAVLQHQRSSPIINTQPSALLSFDGSVSSVSPDTSLIRSKNRFHLKKVRHSLIKLKCHALFLMACRITDLS